MDGSVDSVSDQEDQISDLLSTITGGEAEIQVIIIKLINFSEIFFISRISNLSVDKILLVF